MSTAPAVTGQGGEGGSAPVTDQRDDQAETVRGSAPVTDQASTDKLYVVVGRLADGRQHHEFVTASSDDGLKSNMVHAYGVDEDDITIYELRTA